MSAAEYGLSGTYALYRVEPNGSEFLVGSTAVGTTLTFPVIVGAGDVKFFLLRPQ
jgi:hypothetical protein